MFSCTYNEPARSLASVDSRPTPDSDGCVPVLACAAVRSSSSYVIFLEPVSVRAAPVWPPSAQHRGLWRLLCDVLPCTTSPACRPLPCACLRRKPPGLRVAHLGACAVVGRSTVHTCLWARQATRYPHSLAFRGDGCTLAGVPFFGSPPPSRPTTPSLTCGQGLLFYFLCDARHRPQPPPPALASVQGRAGGAGVGHRGAPTGRIGPPGGVGTLAARPPPEEASARRSESSLAVWRSRLACLSPPLPLPGSAVHQRRVLAASQPTRAVDDRPSLSDGAHLFPFLPPASFHPRPPRPPPPLLPLSPPLPPGLLLDFCSASPCITLAPHHLPP